MDESVAHDVNLEPSQPASHNFSVNDLYAKYCTNPVKNGKIALIARICRFILAVPLAFQTLFSLQPTRCLWRAQYWSCGCNKYHHRYSPFRIVAMKQNESGEAKKLRDSKRPKWRSVVTWERAWRAELTHFIKYYIILSPPNRHTHTHTRTPADQCSQSIHLNEAGSMQNGNRGVISK